MAIFTRGQRVKRIKAGVDDAVPVGSTGTITDPVGCGDDPGVVWDHLGSAHETLYYIRSTLTPLTDPKADAFIESIKRMEREPNNAVPNKSPVLRADEVGAFVREQIGHLWPKPR